jgi:hypothetical protein
MPQGINDVHWGTDSVHQGIFEVHKGERQHQSDQSAGRWVERGGFAAGDFSHREVAPNLLWF